MTNDKVALHITKEASDTLVEDCEFIGFDRAIKNEGKRTKIVGSIFKIVKSILPESLFSKAVVGVVVTVTAGIILWLLKMN